MARQGLIAMIWRIGWLDNYIIPTISKILRQIELLDKCLIKMILKHYKSLT